MHSLEERSGLLMQMNSRTEGRRDRIQFLDKRVLIPFRGTHWQVDGEGRLCVGEELVLPPLMGRGGAMPSNISSPRYLPALVVSLSLSLSLSLSAGSLSLSLSQQVETCIPAAEGARS